MKIFYLLALVLLVSCGKKNETCKNKEVMRIQCEAENTPRYGYSYSNNLCKRYYEAERCY